MNENEREQQVNSTISSQEEVKAQEEVQEEAKEKEATAEEVKTQEVTTSNTEPDVGRKPKGFIISIVIGVVAVLAIAIMIASFLPKKGNKEKNVTDVTEVQEETTVKTEVETESTESQLMLESTPESTLEPTLEIVSEPTEEPTQIVYEGIDYESTLPGIEWVNTLNGIIDEPKLVVFNDTTNKKVIVGNGQEVEFSRSDKIAIYIPEGTGSVITIDMDTFNKSTLGLVSYVEELSRKYEDEKSAVTQNVITFDGQEMTLTATLILTD